MLIGENYISDDVITLGASFHMFFNICLHSRSFPLLAVWRKSDSSVDGKPQGNWWREFKFQRRSCKLSFLFPPCHQSATEGLLAGQLTRKKVLAFYKSKKREVVPLTSLRIVETRLLSKITFTSGVYLLLSSYLLLHDNIYNKLFS